MLKMSSWSCYISWAVTREEKFTSLPCLPVFTLGTIAWCWHEVFSPLRMVLPSSPDPFWDSFIPSPQSLFSFAPSSHWLFKYGKGLLGLQTSSHPCPLCMPLWVYGAQTGEWRVTHLPRATQLKTLLISLWIHHVCLGHQRWVCFIDAS